MARIVSFSFNTAEMLFFAGQLYITSFFRFVSSPMAAKQSKLVASDSQVGHLKHSGSQLTAMDRARFPKLMKHSLGGRDCSL